MGELIIEGIYVEFFDSEAIFEVLELFEKEIYLLERL
jgi:hypothetical protein